MIHVERLTQHLRDHENGTYTNLLLPFEVFSIRTKRGSSFQKGDDVWGKLMQAAFPFNCVGINMNYNLISFVCDKVDVFFVNTNDHWHEAFLGGLNHFHWKVGNV